MVQPTGGVCPSFAALLWREGAALVEDEFLVLADAVENLTGPHLPV